MDHLTPSFAALLELFRPCFRVEVFHTFCLMIPAWLACLGPRTISRVWETTGHADTHSHCPAFRLFSDAKWNWDDLARILLVRLLAVAIPGTRVWLVVDDTLCHKRGAKVAFGGIFLDAVLSSKRHKVFRYGVNWVTLGLVLEFAFRPGHYFCVQLLWRVFKKKAAIPAGERHFTKAQLARQMVDVVAAWLPDRRLVVLGDQAYVNRYLLKRLPDHVRVLGPIHKKAVLTSPLPAGYKGCRKKGDRLTSVREAADDPRWPWEALTLVHPKGVKELQVKVVRDCFWYASAGPRRLQVVLVRDAAKAGATWRDEALLSTDESLTAAEVILGYMRRWSVEVAYGEAKQQLGFHEPRVWCASSVEHAHPTAFFAAGLVLLWYAETGQDEERARRHRPWYVGRAEPTFADMLWCCRLHLWRAWLKREPAREQERLEQLLEYLATAA